MTNDVTARERELIQEAEAVLAVRSGLDERLSALEAELASLRQLYRGAAADAVARSIERCHTEAERLRSAFAELESTPRASAADDGDTVPGFRRRITGLSSLMRV